MVAQRVYNKRTKRYNTLATAKKNGLVEHPERFAVSEGSVLLKDASGRLRLFSKAAGAKRLTDEEDATLRKYNPNLTFNPFTKKVVNKTKANEKRIYGGYVKQFERRAAGGLLSGQRSFDIGIYADKLQMKDIMLGLQKLLLRTSPNDKFVIQIGSTIHTVSRRNIPKLLQLIQRGEADNVTGSDAEFVLALENEDLARTMSIQRITYEGKKHKGGAFWCGVNKTVIPLERYEIFQDEKTENINTVGCLITALKNAGLPEDKLAHLMSTCMTKTVPTYKIKQWVEHYDDITIEITNRKECGEKQLCRFGAGTNVYKLGRVFGHYFVNEPMSCSKYILENIVRLTQEYEGDYEKFKTVCRVKGKWYDRDSKRATMSSFDVISYMYENWSRYFRDFSDTTFLQGTQHFNEEWYIPTLDYDPEVCTKENEFREAKKESFKNVFFDFETYCADDEFQTHIPYLCCSYDGELEQTFYGETSGLQLLESLTEDTRLIAHNSSYDWTFLQKYLTVENTIIKGKKLLTGIFIFESQYNGKIRIQIKDSAQLITAKLSKFGKLFKLEQEKEVMPYKLYNERTVNGRFVPLEEASKLLSTKDYIQFLANCSKWDLIDEVRFDCIEYSARYCQIDCRVLYAGYQEFKRQVEQVCGLDVDCYLTQASLADAFMKKRGCYDGVYQLAGNVRAFCQRAVVGGRTMLAENKKWHVKGKIADYDACSLYPSAMNRLDGFPLGRPEVIKSFDRAVDYYIVEVKINKVGKNRSFPLMSYKDEEGLRQWTNDMEGKTVIIDKTTYEDWVEFQHVQMEFIRGYQWNEGFNRGICEVIGELYSKRRELKKAGEPIQELYKLLMNSSYGKSILKPIDKDMKWFKNREALDRYIGANFDMVEEAYQLNGSEKWIAKVSKPIVDHFNNTPCGVSILSMSKRIMNEVMCLAEDKGLRIYYQDTDSMHIDYDSVPVLEDAFQNKYGRVLAGNEMGNFHIDFDLAGAKGSSIHSTEFIGLGKKCYIDRLVGDSETGELVEGYHMRMKGVSNGAIEHCYTNEETNPLALYSDMYHGEEKEFDLLCGGAATVFDCNRFSYGMKSQFKRVLKFDSPAMPVICL